MGSPGPQATDDSSFVFNHDFSPHWLLAYKQLLVEALRLTYYLVDTFPAETEFVEWSAVHWWISDARCIFWNNKKSVSGTMWLWTLFEIDIMMLMIAWEHSSITTLDFLCYMLQPEQYWTKLSWFTLTVPLFFFILVCFGQEWRRWTITFVCPMSWLWACKHDCQQGNLTSQKFTILPI